MFKYFQQFLIFSLLTLFVFSFNACNPDDDDFPDLPPTGEPQELSGTINTPRVLENIYSNPNAVDYIVTGTLNIDAALEIMPGVNIEMTPGVRINVNSMGSLSAVGEEDMPIQIFGSQRVEGYWDFVRFNNSNNPNNSLIYTKISDGGGTTFREAMVVVSGSSQVKIQHSTISNSARNGIYLEGASARLPEFSNNVIDGCGLYPLHLRSLSQAGQIDFETIFTGSNTYDMIYVSGANEDVPFSLRKLQGPILLDGGPGINADMTIEPGVTLLMAQAARITVNSGGSLNATGTVGDRITILGLVETTGFFDFIRFNNSNNPQNQFRYVDVSYGGGSTFRNAMVYVDGSSMLTIGNSSFNYSGNHGICFGNNANLIDEGTNDFTGNTMDDICE